MKERIIPGVPRVTQFMDDVSYLTPFIGSLWAALHGLGQPRPYADLLALSGAGNRLCWLPGHWNGGNVDILYAEESSFAPHRRVLRALGMGATVRLCRETAGLPGPYVAEEQARAEIVDSLDRGIPVIAMGIIGPPECCVVFGYTDEGGTLTGWNYFQADEGFDAVQPFLKDDWFPGLYGYLLLEQDEPAPSRQESALAVFRAITAHAYGSDARAIRVGFAAWEAMLDQLEHDDFTGLPLMLPGPGEPWDDDVFESTVQGRFFVYCDSLCQIHERGVALPYYRSLAEDFPRWQPHLQGAIAAWRSCADYGGYLWQHVSMSPEGYEKFRTLEIRRILAAEGRRSMALDREAIGHIEVLLAREQA